MIEKLLLKQLKNMLTWFIYKKLLILSFPLIISLSFSQFELYLLKIFLIHFIFMTCNNLLLKMLYHGDDNNNNFKKKKEQQEAGER